ncbi:Ankyrin repeat-containing protein BDA1 [Bienertia sinuspersici]
MMIEKRLHEAAFEGNISNLNTLIKEDPLILDRIFPTFFQDTPLHISILRGHIDFARDVLTHNPRLATECDSLGHLPLHVASTKGHIEIVRELLRVSQGACLARSKDGKLPLHLAIMKGVKVEVVTELVQACPESTRSQVDRRDSVLHLCVKYENFDALQMLVGVLKSEKLGSNDLLNARNDDGNTVLHLAALYKHLEITKFLLATPGIEVNAMNKNGLTPLNLVENSPRDLKGLEILNILLQSNVQTSTKNNSSPATKHIQPSISEKTPTPTKPKKSWKSIFTFHGINKNLEDMKGQILIVAAIIALIDALPIIYLKVNGPDIPEQFWVNSASFVPAVTIILLLMGGLPLTNKFCSWLVIQLMYTAVGFMGFNYFDEMLSNESRYSKLGFAVVVMMIWFLLLIIVSGLNIIRLIVLVVEIVQKRRKLRNKRANDAAMLSA